MTKKTSNATFLDWSALKASLPAHVYRELREDAPNLGKQTLRRWIEDIQRGAYQPDPRRRATPDERRDYRKLYRMRMNFERDGGVIQPGLGIEHYSKVALKLKERFMLGFPEVQLWVKSYLRLYDELSPQKRANLLKGLFRLIATPGAKQGRWHWSRVRQIRKAANEAKIAQQTPVACHCSRRDSAIDLTLSLDLDEEPVELSAPHPTASTCRCGGASSGDPVLDELLETDISSQFEIPWWEDKACPRLTDPVSLEELKTLRAQGKHYLYQALKHHYRLKDGPNSDELYDIRCEFEQLDEEALLHWFKDIAARKYRSDDGYANDRRKHRIDYLRRAKLRREGIELKRFFEPYHYLKEAFIEFVDGHVTPENALWWEDLITDFDSMTPQARKDAIRAVYDLEYEFRVSGLRPASTAALRRQQREVHSDLHH